MSFWIDRTALLSFLAFYDIARPREWCISDGKWCLIYLTCCTYFWNHIYYFIAIFTVSEIQHIKFMEGIHSETHSSKCSLKLLYSLLRVAAVDVILILRLNYSLLRSANPCELLHWWTNSASIVRLAWLCCKTFPDWPAVNTASRKHKRM